MKLVLDMNLSPSLAGPLSAYGHEAVHRSHVGSVTAKDEEILEWARANRCVLITHDLDFGALLAASERNGPSVLQIRTHDLHADAYLPILLSVLQQEQETLMRGALITVDARRIPRTHTSHRSSIVRTDGLSRGRLAAETPDHGARVLPHGRVGAVRA